MHGKTSTINITKNTPIFKDISNHFKATRYHSLVVKKDSLPNVIIPTAFSDDDGEIMALEIADFQIYGVQFHPESIMSDYGHKIIQNFLDL